MAAAWKAALATFVAMLYMPSSYAITLQHNKSVTVVPLVHYTFDSVSSQVTDTGTLGYHGTINGVESQDWQWLTSGGIHNSGTFYFKQDNNQGFIDLSAHPNPSAGNAEATWSFWIKPEDLTNYQQLYIQESSVWMGIYHCDGNQLGFDWKADGHSWADGAGGCSKRHARMGSNLQVNEWVHIAVTLQNQVLKGYLSSENGPTTLVFTWDTTGSGLENGPAAGSTPRGIGARGAGSGPYKGYLDDFRIYGQALSASQIESVVLSVPTSPTPANNEASGTGDPHLKNMRGESFDLLRPGKFLLIDIPRGRPVEDALLVVEADAHRLGGDCADLYFVALNITGAWADMAQTGGLRFDAYATPDEKPKWAKFGPVDLKIAHGRTVQGTRYLNVYARHLGRAGFAVGGLLGEDDHSEAVVPTDDCLKKMFLSRKGAGKGLPRAGSVAEAV